MSNRNASISIPMDSLEPQFPSGFYGDAKGWTGRFISCLKIPIPGVMNPRAILIRRWNKFFVISCLVAIFVDPLFFFVLSVLEDKKCIVINWNLTLTIVVFRSLIDFIYLLHMLLQFRLAYVAPESPAELVDTPKKIAMHYFRGFFFLDLFIVLPLPQIIVLQILPKNLGSSGENYAKNLLRTAILLQYVPRLFRLLPPLIGKSPNGFIFETVRANFVINLLAFVLSSHVVGACWYLFGLQRVNQCLRDACGQSDSKNYCKDFLDCGYGNNVDRFVNESIWSSWKNNENATACFTTVDNFSFGIYNQAINLTTKQNVVTRYIYSLFWGFQQISTLAGNQVPSYFIWEVLFTMAIVGLGILLFAFLIGNMQNFLQAFGRRRLEMLLETSLRQLDVEQWMNHLRLPPELRRKVVEAERYNWAITRGVNEEALFDSLPEDLQRDIRAYRFSFVRQVWIFKHMDDHVLDAIYERLKQKIYFKGSKILHQGGVIDKMLLIVRGKLVSVGEDCTEYLTDGDVCGEELLTWHLDNTNINKDGRKIKTAGHRLFRSRTVICLTKVEAFALRESDLEEVTSLFARNLQHPRIQGAIRYQSRYWRTSAALRIQVAWRYRQKRQKRGNASASNVNY